MNVNFLRMDLVCVGNQVLESVQNASEVTGNFTSLPFDYLLFNVMLSWVTNYAHTRTFFDMFIVSIENSTH